MRENNETEVGLHKLTTPDPSRRLHTPWHSLGIHFTLSRKARYLVVLSFLFLVKNPYCTAHHDHCSGSAQALRPQLSDTQ